MGIPAFCHILLCNFFSREKRSSIFEHFLCKSSLITSFILVTHPCRQSWLQFSLASVSREVTSWIRQKFNWTVETVRVRRESVFWRKTAKYTRRIRHVFLQVSLSLRSSSSFTSCYCSSTYSLWVWPEIAASTWKGTWLQLGRCNEKFSFWAISIAGWKKKKKE